jgi:hypothetical protein
MVYNTEKTLNEHRDKISDEDAKTIEVAHRNGQEGHEGRRRQGDQRSDREPDHGQPQAGRGDV